MWKFLILLISSFFLVTTFAHAEGNGCPRPRASSPVLVDEGGNVVNEDTTCSFFNRWIALSVTVPSEPGGHVFTVRSRTFRLESGSPDRLEAIEILFDGRRLTRFGQAELEQVGTPVLSRMRVVTFGGNARSLEIRLPIISQCGDPDDARLGSDSYHPLEVDDPGGADVYFNGYAIIHIQVPLGGTRAFHTIHVYRCDEGILERLGRVEEE